MEGPQTEQEGLGWAVNSEGDVYLGIRCHCQQVMRQKVLVANTQYTVNLILAAVFPYISVFRHVVEGPHTGQEGLCWSVNSVGDVYLGIRCHCQQVMGQT